MNEKYYKANKNHHNRGIGGSGLGLSIVKNVLEENQKNYLLREKIKAIKEEIGEYPILLLDDVLSELDSGRQERLLNMTTKYQTFISCTSIPNTNLLYNKKEIRNGKVIQ